MNILGISIAIVSAALLIAYLWIGAGPLIALAVGSLLVLGSSRVLFS